MIPKSGTNECENLESMDTDIKIWENINEKKNWRVPFGTQRVEAEGMIKNEQRH
jgi:hypothetical protein